jgi:hypothetical protein
MFELKEKAFTRKRKSHRLFWPDHNIWRTIPLFNVVESNWAFVAGLVPSVDSKGFRTPQQVPPLVFWRETWALGLVLYGALCTEGALSKECPSWSPSSMAPSIGHGDWSWSLAWVRFWCDAMATGLTLPYF